MNINRQQKLAQIPKAYRANYKKAIHGKSLRACVNAQCLECVCWQIKEIRLCTSLACPLYAVRPYQKILQNPHNEGFSGVENENSGQGYIG